MNWPWQPVIDWDAPAGRLLLAFAKWLPEELHAEITIFGSAPLQLTMDPGFLSNDVDVFSAEDFTEILQQAGLGKGGSDFYIEQTPANVFRTGLNWRSRAFSESKGSVKWVFPHPLDILVSKIKRLAPKDLLAFQMVREKTGRPTESDLKEILAEAVDIYRPDFDEENPGGDPIVNTGIVWEEIFGKQIDVRREIIAPALAARRAAYGMDAPDYKSRLFERAEEWNRKK